MLVVTLLTLRGDARPGGMGSPFLPIAIITRDNDRSHRLVSPSHNHSPDRAGPQSVCNPISTGSRTLPCGRVGNRSVCPRRGFRKSVDDRDVSCLVRYRIPWPSLESRGNQALAEGLRGARGGQCNSQPSRFDGLTDIGGALSHTVWGFRIILTKLDRLGFVQTHGKHPQHEKQLTDRSVHHAVTPTALISDSLPTRLAEGKPHSTDRSCPVPFRDRRSGSASRARFQRPALTTRIVLDDDGPRAFGCLGSGSG